MIARGGVFGDRAVDLRLLDIEAASDKLRAVGMELQDVASPFVLRCTCTTDPLEAFMDADVALLVGARPRGPGMLRKDLLAANAGIFKAQGAVLDEVASRDCKVVVVGNPANTNALLCMRSAPSLPKRNFTALTRLDQNRTAGMLAAKIGELARSCAAIPSPGDPQPLLPCAASRSSAMGLPASCLPSVRPCVGAPQACLSPRSATP